MKSLVILLSMVSVLTAHPLPSLRYDRAITVRVTATGVEVIYILELNELSMFLDKSAQPSEAERRILQVAKPSEKAPAALYALKKLRLLRDELSVKVDGQPLVAEEVSQTQMRPNADHLEIAYRLKYPWGINHRDGVQHFAFLDGSFESTSGRIALVFAADGAVTVSHLVEPGPLKDISPLDLKPGEEQKLRSITASLRVVDTRVTVPTPAPPIFAVPPPRLTEDLYARGLTALFDSDAGIFVLLLAAGLFGMGHALTPGHGKTMVAAYLVGERGTLRHAVVLGITTTLAHTGSVIGVAVVLAAFYRDGVPQTAQGWLQLAGGMLILVVGVWLLLQRLRGRADHVHLFRGHDRASFGWGRVILLGLGGGLVPCWDAVMLLFVAISAGRLGFAIPLLIAFSIGLAAILVLLGIGVVLAHRAGAARFAERRWFRLLPTISAAILIVMGLWLARDGVHLLSSSH